MGQAIDFRAYAGEAFLGSLERGEGIAAFVRPGRTEIRVRPHFLGIPDGWPEKLELDLRAGERYYLRFSPVHRYGGALAERYTHKRWNAVTYGYGNRLRQSGIMRPVSAFDPWCIAGRKR